eukprot:2429033-Alexandrium_andersonii.AAC.1
MRPQRPSGARQCSRRQVRAPEGRRLARARRAQWARGSGGVAAGPASSGSQSGADHGRTNGAAAVGAD